MNVAACSARIALTGMLAMAVGGARVALADDQPDQAYPALSGDGDLELRFDTISQSNDGANQRLDSYFKGQANFALAFTPEFSVRSLITVDSLRGPRPHRDRFITGTGAYLEQLYLNYETDTVAAYVGKIGPTFGIAWDKLPDLLQDDISAAYKLAEMIGAGGGLTFNLETLGKHRLDAAAFFADTTFLHRSLFSAPGSDDEQVQRISHFARADGGLANTGKPNNFSATLSGSDFADLPGMFYQIGYRHLAPGRGESRSEDAAIAALGWNVKLDEEIVLTPFVEAARFWNFNGGRADAAVVTAALLVRAEPWEIALAGSWRGVGNGEGAPRSNDYSLAFQVGYGLGNGFSIGAGYRHERIEGVDADIVRSFLGYAFDFGKPATD
jgi:hypothetical protein